MSCNAVNVKCHFKYILLLCNTTVLGDCANRYSRCNLIDGEKCKSNGSDKEVAQSEQKFPIQKLR